MHVLEIKHILSKYNDQDHLGVMFVTPEEVKEICGKIYPEDNVVRVLNLLSREPNDTYWYQHNSLFSDLIKDAAREIGESDIDDKVRESNDALSIELGLRYCISLGFEVRPLKIFEASADGSVEVRSNGAKLFTLPRRSTYADFLTMLNDVPDVRPFLEGWEATVQSDGQTVEYFLDVYFGS